MSRALAFTAVGVWLLGGCGEISNDMTQESAKNIQQALDEANGGQDMADENAAFGLVDLTDEALDPNEIAPPETPDELARLVRDETGLADGNLPDINAPACAHGLLGGKWVEVGKGYGVFRGRWASANGQVEGHLKGIWGRTRGGAQRFFGKTISRSGEFRGLIKGHYANGSFAGHYIDRSGIKGVLHGAYGDVRAHCATDDRELDVRVARTDDTSVEPSTPDRRCAPDKGFFVGKWRELCQTNRCEGNADCNQPLCGGQVCGPNEWCCGPPECGWCAPNGTLPPCLAECPSL